MIRFNTIVVAVLLALVAGQAFGKDKDQKPKEKDKNILRILTPKTVFVTSEQFAGSLGGLGGADAKCQAAADAAGLGGTFMAWLSDEDSTAAERFKTLALGPYIDTKGATVAGGWGDLTDGTLNAPIMHDENGDDRSNSSVWTGTEANGSGASTNCQNWTSASAAVNGTDGVSDQVNDGWTNRAGEFDCAAFRRLYCFEQ